MINVCELLRGIESELRTLLRENIQFQVVLPDVPVMLMVDVLQFERVLMNLVTNARDAMPAGGSLVIQVEYRNIDRAFIKAHGFGEPGTYVGIAISDTGVGIEKDKIKSIFEPFFTTKKVSKGTGLGLALVYGIVKEHSGYITVYSEPDRGTTLRLYFPITEASSEAVKGGPPLKSLQGSETILLVEDETPLRSLVKSVLEEFGYTVFAVQDGDEAVRCFIEEPSRYDLVVIDMIMPKRDGKAVYGEIKKTRPDIKVIFTSGYTEDILRLRNILDTKHVFIEKPFSPVTMLAKIRNVLGTTKTSEDLGSSQERASYN
jgi:CheY-like chemotaxis protein/two-component sensor histidine kinase